MHWQYKRHYTREEANALLPEVRRWLEQLTQERARLARLEQRTGQLLTGGDDIGGALVNEQIEALVQLRRALSEFQRRDIQLKDLERGLVDFPAIIGGREVFLCWEKDEETVEYWHDLESGYAGRELLE